jgi:hypothetical protein
MPSSISSDKDEKVVKVSTDNEADSQCQYYSRYYSEDRHGEKWVQCTQCYIWCHKNVPGQREKEILFAPLVFSE